jgi:hypothetical protein
MKLNDRVRLTGDVDIFQLGSFLTGATGTVVWADPDPGADHGMGHLFEVRLDEYFPELDAWDNCLQVFRPDEAECTTDDWDLI